MFSKTLMTLFLVAVVIGLLGVLLFGAGNDIEIGYFYISIVFLIGFLISVILFRAEPKLGRSFSKELRKLRGRGPLVKHENKYYTLQQNNNSSNHTYSPKIEKVYQNKG